MKSGHRIEVETGAILVGAAALLILPLPLLLSFLLAAVIHEWCHYAALWMMGVNVYKITVGCNGASMETEYMEPGREVVCALAGPMGSFLLAAGYRIFPQLAVYGLIQGCFNLLPVYPLDGGRVLKGILEILRIPARERIVTFFRCLAGIGIGWGCIHGLKYWNLGYGILFLGGVLLLRIFPRKTPCKDAFFGVQ